MCTPWTSAEARATAAGGRFGWARVSVRARVLEASAGRDRVTDAVKALALLLVVVGHSLAWNVTPSGGLDNTLNYAPQLWWLTWLLQILPLFFFIAGSGMVRLAADRSAQRYLVRTARLLEPALLLFVLALIVSIALKATAPASLQRSVGVLLVQLTWFLGVYLLLVSLAPAITRAARPAGVALLVAAIAAVDFLRVHVASGLGWVNMVLVWALFAVLGTQHQRLRAAPPRLKAIGLAVSLSAAAVLIVQGPYAKAMITADRIPGISNLAPPSLVLACAGAAQVFALMLVWPRLEQLLRRDRLWVAVALFGSRAMQVYLYHLLFLVIFVVPFFITRSSAVALSMRWWGQHALVFALTMAAVFVAAPVLRSASRALASVLAACVQPASTRARLAGMSTRSARLLAAATGVALLVQSSTGVGDILTARVVLGVAVYPVVTWLVIIASLAIHMAATRKAAAD